jgi:glycosyltransferase 2 family protein
MAKRLALLSLQLAVTAVGIYYVFHDPGQRVRVAEALDHADLRWLVLGWACYGLVEGLATLRWQLLLRVQGVILGWWRAGAIVVIGLFFNLFLPGLVGGDAMRLYLIFKEVPGKKTRAALSIVLDRSLGLISILVLAALVVIFRFGWLSHYQATAHITYLALGLLTGSALFAIGLLSAVKLGVLERLPKKLPFRRGIMKAGAAVNLYASRPGISVAALGLTILSHCAYYLSYYCAAGSLHRSAGMRPGLLDFMSIMPLVNSITGVPISFGGVGLRETLFQKLLGDLAGMPLAPAALAASLGFAIQASWGILGGLAFLFMPFPARRR